MILAASRAFSTAGLAFSLIIQSGILLATPDRLKLFARQVQKLALIVAMPIGFILVIVGSIWFPSSGSFIVVGVTFIILAISLVVQSRILSSPGDQSLKRFGKLLKILAFVLCGAVVIAAVILSFKLITAVV